MLITRPSRLRLIWARLTDRESYRRLRTRAKLARFNQRFVQRSQVYLQRLPEPHHGKPSVAFKHSGNAGDIVYALPALRSLAGNSPIELYLVPNVSAWYVEGVHPAGETRMSERISTMMLPLLRAQPGVLAAEIYRRQPIDFDLDLFRHAPFEFDRGSIPRWYLQAFGITADLCRPWLAAEPDLRVRNHILIARSQRYRNPVIDYRFLARYPQVACVGVPEEYEDLRRQVPNLEYLPITDFAELAGLVAGARLFVGNQSFPFAIAEALKVPRVLEVCPYCPNVVPDGGIVFDAVFQPHLEAAVRTLYDRE